MKYPLTKFAQKCSDGWIDRCPAHDDNNPSLSIKETSDGKLLLHCFAGARKKICFSERFISGIVTWHQ